MTYPKELEVILARHLASSLAIPMFLINPQADLIYFNTLAERILGQRYDETGVLTYAEWSTLMTFRDKDGNKLVEHNNPFLVSLRTEKLINQQLWLETINQNKQCLTISCIPLLGQTYHFFGVLVIVESQVEAE
ncbi:MAG TPA: hypothetical protein VLL52_07370 [Anaerolineae bacterium]|nr:hypothetical protein [Anaerolineae bacterium]